MKTNVQLQITPDVTNDVYNMIGFEHKFKNETIAYEDLLPSLGSPEDFPMYVVHSPRYELVTRTSHQIIIENISLLHRTKQQILLFKN